jgi:hypothetical protein
MTRKLALFAGTAAVLALVPLFTAPLSLAQSDRQLSSNAVKMEKELPKANNSQRHLVRVVDVSDVSCGSTVAFTDPTALENEKLALLAHRARLEAEVQGRDTIVIPEELRGREATEPVQRAFRDEAGAMQSRAAQFAEQIASVQQSIELMKRESEVIHAKDALMQRQVSLLRDQLDAVDGLLKRGSATVSQKLALEQTLAQYESSHLDLQLSGLKSGQDLIKAQQSIGEGRNQLRAQDLVELGQTQARISELLKEGSAATKPPATACESPGQVFEIVRDADGKMQVLPIAPIETSKPDAVKTFKAS